MAEALPTDDGRYVVIGGRRWRATDPTLSPDDATALRHGLMSARRGVKAARRSGDPAAERAARDLVQRFKVGLGERGTPWWEQTGEERAARVRDALATPANDDGGGDGTGDGAAVGRAGRDA